MNTKNSFEQRSAKSYGKVAATIVAALGLSGAVNAVTVTNLTSGSTAFSDNFENGSFMASVGAWSLLGPGVSVINSAVSPDPGPIQGAFYARLFRDDPLTPNLGNTDARLSSPQANLGDLISLSLMVYVPNDGANARATLVLSDGDFMTARALVRTDGLGNVIALGSGFAAADTGIDYVPNSWQRWDLSYAIGSGTFSVSVAGVGVAGLVSPTIGQVSVANIFNGSATPGAIYVDALPVPEPTSYSLMGAGVIVLLSLRRSRV